MRGSGPFGELIWCTSSSPNCYGCYGFVAYRILSNPTESYRFAMICLPWVACRLLVAAICLWFFFFSNRFLWAGVWPCATQIWGESTTHSPSPPKTFVSQTQKVTRQRRNALPWSALICLDLFISSSLHLFLEQSLISIHSISSQALIVCCWQDMARYGQVVLMSNGFLCQWAYAF